MNAKQGLVIAVLVLATTVVARWSVTRGNDEHEAIGVHGEQVFRLQNAVISRLIDAGETDIPPSPRDSAALLAAEDRIVSDCRHLNEAASLSAGGGEPGLSLQLRVLDSLDTCEAAALAVRAQMDAEPSALRASLP